LPRPLAVGTSVEQLRKKAKRWLKALRAREPGARDRLIRAWPDAPVTPGLRDVQYALAREHGLAGWTALKDAVAVLERGGSSREQALHALLRAANQGDVHQVCAILDTHPDVINERGTLDGHSGLRTALHFGQHSEEVVRTLLERGADPNIRDEGDNAFPLHFACERGDLAVIKLLVEHGAQTVAGEVDNHELDIIGWATCFPGVEIRPEVVEYLLAHGARHTLHSAVAVGDLETIRARARENPAALERPMDKVNRRRTALHLAVLKDQPRSLQTLLELGVNPDGSDAGGLTAIDEAAVRSRADMVQMLVDAGATLTLASALALNRTDIVERLLRENPDALEPGHKWGTLIVRAAAEAPAQMIQTLIDLGASVDVQDAAATSVDGTRGYTALHAAAFHGNLVAVDVLLKNGATPTVRDSRYCGTPAGWARYARKQEAFERLMSGGLDMFDAIDFDRPDRIPEILRRDPPALKRPFGAYLLPGSVPPGWCPDLETTPLEWAARQNKAQAMRALVAHGAELAAGGHLARTHDDRVAAFLRMACLDWGVGGNDRVRHTHAAERLLRRHPEIARDSIYTAVACGDVDELQRILDEHSDLANTRGGPRGWPPLLYLCAARLTDHPPSAENALAIARMLLDAGADPNVYYAGGNERIHYTALTSVIGRGEEQAAMHPQARALAALLLERGAEPYDKQVLYNGFGGHASHRHLADDDLVWFLEMMYAQSLKRGRQADWADPDWPMLEMGGYGCGTWYLLSSALKGNYLTIAEWVLSHGANPNPPRAADPRTPPGTLYEQAVRAGLMDFAGLLGRYGAPRTEPSEDSSDAFATACFRLDLERARAMTAAHPEYLSDATLLMRAAERDRVDVAELLLDLGVSPNVEDRNKTRPLHLAAYEDSPRVAALLVGRRAEIDPRDEVHSATPIYWALWGQRGRMVEMLTPVSRDVWALVPAGKLARLREVLAVEPRLARSFWEGGTPLFTLPDDEELAVEIVKLFLAHGADASIARKDGTTAEGVARARGLDAAADLLRDR
jgi:ankyrin repeat protein